MTGTQTVARDPVLCMNDEKQTLARFQSACMYANTHIQVHTRRAYVHKHTKVGFIMAVCPSKQLIQPHPLHELEKKNTPL